MAEVKFSYLHAPTLAVKLSGNQSVPWADTCLLSATSTWKTDLQAPSRSHPQGPQEPFSPCLDIRAGLRSTSVQKNSWTQNALEISSKSSFLLCFAGSIYLQCCPNDSSHDGKLRFPKMGPRGWLVHGFVFYGADTRLYGIYVSNPERLLKTGKSLSWLRDVILPDLCALIKDCWAVIFY